MIDPDVLKGALTHIAHNHLWHEVAGMHISPVIYVGNLDACRAAACIG